MSLLFNTQFQAIPCSCSRFKAYARRLRPVVHAQLNNFWFSQPTVLVQMRLFDWKSEQKGTCRLLMSYRSGQHQDGMCFHMMMSRWTGFT